MKMMSYFNVKIKLNPYESYDALFIFYAEVPGSGSAGVRRQSGKYKLYVMEESGTWKINTDKEGYFCRYDSDFSMAN